MIVAHYRLIWDEVFAIFHEADRCHARQKLQAHLLRLSTRRRCLCQDHTHLLDTLLNAFITANTKAIARKNAVYFQTAVGRQKRC